MPGQGEINASVQMIIGTDCFLNALMPRLRETSFNQRNPVWVDTVNISYGSSVDLVMDFTDPIIRGMSLFHCHLLSHEDKGMMAKILFR